MLIFPSQATENLVFPLMTETKCVFITFMDSFKLLYFIIIFGVI